jgi:hypothetical protein
MAKLVAYKPIKSASDTYQTSVSTNYQKDQTTGELFKTSGNNVRTIIPEQFKSAKLIARNNYASNGYNTIYTIPAGKVFILTSAAFWQNAAALTTGNSGQLRVVLGATTYPLVEIRGTAAASNISFPLTYSALMVFQENFKFEVGNATANLTTGASVLGYEIDSSEYLGVFN